MKRPCKGCVYEILVGGTYICDYISRTGRRRGCPPGEDCEKRKERRSRGRRKARDAGHSEDAREEIT